MNWFRTLVTGKFFQQLGKPVGAIGAPGRRLTLETLDDRCLLSTGISLFNVPVAAPLTTAAPLGITAGPDGNLWFTDKASHAAGKITPAGVVTEYPTTIPAFGAEDPQTTHTIVAGPDGNLWLTDYESDYQHTGFPRIVSRSEIIKVTPTGVVTEFKLPDATSGPLGITVGPDGKLWFAESRANKVGSITTDGTIQEFTVPNITHDYYSPFTVLDITTGPDGNLWYTETASRVGRIATNGTSLGEVTLSVPARGITAGPDGNVWVTESTGFARITPAGAATEFTPFSTGSTPQDSTSGPDAIVTGPDRNLWFTENGALPSGTKIGSIRPDGGLGVELANPPSSTGAVLPGITVGPGGTLWFTDFFRGQIGVVHNYVETLFEKVLARKAAPAEQNYWNNVWGQNGQAAVAGGVQGSDESHTLLVNGWYQTYLGRKAEAGGVQYFVNLLRTLTEEQALAQLFASPEYYNRAPNVPGVGGGSPSDTTLVQAIYQQLLGRAAGAGEVAYWQPQVAAQGRAFVAQQIMGSDEYRRDAIQSAYHTLLHRSSPATPADVNYWLSQNLDNQRLKVAFEQTEEFALSPLK